jgi:hypothetical protein
MIWALLAVMFFGGGVQDAVLDDIKETKGAVSDVVEDKSRRSDINATLSEMKKRSKQRNKSAKQALKELQGEMAEHDINEAGLDTVFDNYLASLHEYNNDMIDLRFQLRDQLSREEWEVLFSVE